MSLHVKDRGENGYFLKGDNFLIMNIFIYFFLYKSLILSYIIYTIDYLVYTIFLYNFYIYTFYLSDYKKNLKNVYIYENCIEI